MTSLRLSFLLLITLLSGNAAVAQTQTAMRWEYKTTSSCDQAATSLNELGDVGWEMVTVENYSNSSCVTYHLKRQKPKDAPAYVRPESQPPKPAPPPRCQLTIDQAPAIRGFRLGMDVNEILALMPEGVEKFNVKTMLEKASRPPGYGLTDFSISRNQVLPTQANLERFAGVEDFRFFILDNRIVEINVKYSSLSSRERPNWTAQSWAAKIVQAFSLPDLSFWDTKVYPRRITCSGFSASINHSDQSVGIRDTSFQKTIDQRRAAEQERMRREFKP